jgi:redox-sensitive bicupin YhaK (pirin superfamily)
VIDAQPTIEGAGVHLSRSVGSGALPMLDPFLMLDEIRSPSPEDYLPGFPTHPHRGFETVTYMISGAMEHRDSLGNHGRLGPGSAQWMTAGHGIIHSEMPSSSIGEETGGLVHGLQLWVNLPAARKMIAPRYQDLAPEAIPTITSERCEVRLVAGELDGRVGPVSGIATDPHMLDVSLERRARFSHSVPSEHNAFAYVLEGAARFGEDATRVQRGQLAVLERGETIVASSDSGARFLLLAGRPIGERVARWGPFVMSTDEEIQQAIDDYRGGRLTIM